MHQPQTSEPLSRLETYQALDRLEKVLGQMNVIIRDLLGRKAAIEERVKKMGDNFDEPLVDSITEMIKTLTALQTFMNYVSGARDAVHAMAKGDPEFFNKIADMEKQVLEISTDMERLREEEKKISEAM